MNISELSIRRPVLATVLTIIILLFGFIGYSYLGVREYPSVDNPIISVSCSYPGANADVIENQITEPLEQNINGIPGIRSLSSVIHHQSHGQHNGKHGKYVNGESGKIHDEECSNQRYGNYDARNQRHPPVA